MRGSRERTSLSPCKEGMAGPTHLLTEQDIHAYVDGELTGDRRRAVEAFLTERELPLRQAAAYLRNTFDLRAMRDEIYADESLRSEIETLLEKRAAKMRAAAAG